MIDERVLLTTNAQGHPILTRSGDHRIDVLLSEDSASGFTNIEILGDEAALRRLGEVLIGVSKAKGYHVHLESNTEVSPLDIKPGHVRLIISNVEMPTQVTMPSSQPPDWARG